MSMVLRLHAHSFVAYASDWLHFCDACSFEQHLAVHVHMQLDNKSMNLHSACDLAVLA